jgi:GNAT superfamily N-acetyltransferase
MTWRLTAKEFQLRKGTGNRRAMKKVVTAGPPPGILAYSGGKAVGWCSIAPRSEFVRLVKSRVLAPVDDQDVWSVTCFFVRRDFRKQGLALALLKAAAAFAKRKGAKLIEGYPQELTKELPAPFVWTGLASSFRKAGFEVAERRSPTRPIMRKKT